MVYSNFGKTIKLGPNHKIVISELDITPKIMGLDT